jgi:hypothetical protein
MADNKGRKSKTFGKNKSYYQVQAMRSEKNKTKKILRHFKSNPEDQVAGAYLTAKKYNLKDIQLTSKGRKVAKLKTLEAA